MYYFLLLLLEEFVRLLDNAPWNDFYNDTDPNVLWDLFRKYTLEATEILCQKKSRNTRNPGGQSKELLLRL